MLLKCAEILGLPRDKTQVGEETSLTLQEKEDIQKCDGEVS
jgi:hypothetical protein